MRWFFATQKAATRFLYSQQYRLHGGSASELLLPISIDPPFYRFPANMQHHSIHPHLFSAHHYRTTALLNTNTTDECSLRVHDEYHAKKVDLQILSTETIKPSSPTPHHLRILNLSAIDKMLDFSTPLILFLPNNDNLSVTQVVAKRSKHLKESLSETLTRYYPFAGEVKNNNHIECNDKGIYFVEARVNQTLQDFLHQPDDDKLRELTPTIESSSKNQIASFQVNVFDCGGIALCTNLSHKIVDGGSYFSFMNAWAATVKGSSKKTLPTFLGSELFPHNVTIKHSMPSKLKSNKVHTTRRFVFNSTALASLKAQSHSHVASRTQATGAVVWKAAAKAASTVRSFGPGAPHVLNVPVNLRSRVLPCLPEDSIGNAVMPALGICFPESEPTLPTLMGEMRESIAKLNADSIEAMRGEKGQHALNEAMKSMTDLFDKMDEGDCLQMSSLLNTGVMEMDFGWAKPIWFYSLNPGLSRMATLNDTKNGRGVEAMVSLSPEEMEIFECDPDILSHTTVDPSPLHFLN